MSGREGTIVKGIAGFYYVKSGDDLYRCRARGIFKARGVKPAVGDRVEFEILEGNDDNWITGIEPRRNEFVRPFIVNVDCFVIVTAAARPAPVPAVIDKLTVMAERKGTEVLLCINKADLTRGSSRSSRRAKEALELLQDKYRGVYPVIVLDSVSGEGYEELLERIRGRRVALAGPSGTGKSTITNHLIPEAEAETGKISEKSKRGRHTTRHSELFAVDGQGTMIFDTPGFTSFELEDVEEEELQHLYPEIAACIGNCRYSDCRHLAEPGCAVLRAVEEKRIHPLRYASYAEQLRELRDRRQY